MIKDSKEKEKYDAPLMILSSGKVVGNVGPQWKEVRDNRGHNKGKQAEGNGTAGTQLVPIDIVAKQVQTNNKKVQVTNQFTVLGIEEGENEDQK